MEKAAAQGGSGPAPKGGQDLHRPPHAMILSGIALMHPAGHFGEAATVRSAGGFGTGSKCSRSEPTGEILGATVRGVDLSRP